VAGSKNLMLLFYCHTITPRLQYIVAFFNKELFEEPIQITTNAEEFKSGSGPRLSYSEKRISDNDFFIQNTSLLFETGIVPQNIKCFEKNKYKAFFSTQGDWHFDILAASFYLLSRYEEYLPYEKDMYGRYAHTNSLAFREDFLHVPLVNVWLDDFRKALQQKFPAIRFRRGHFKCVLSYDVDIAYSYLEKGFVRTAGGFGRSMLKGRWKEVNERWQVLRGKKKDPFDCFEWLDALHLYCRLKPYFFFLVAEKTSQYDKNVSLNSPLLQNLIAYYAASYKVGVHPSWQSGDDEKLLREELEWLEVMADRKLIHSRQHYIRFTLPQTFRQLIAAGIEKDFSMGYGSINGFRASVCSSFAWYDLEAEKSTSLILFPFCFMDANSYYEQKQTPQQAYSELLLYYEQVKRLKGIFISVWHNFILGTDKEFKDWRDMFELFMKETVYWDAYYDGV
jgi:hypothetical protein